MARNSFSLSSANAYEFNLVAASGTADPKDPDLDKSDIRSPTNYFKSAQWSADGTCLISSTANGDVQTFVIPPDLLDERPHPLQLKPYATIPSREPVDAVCGYPAFELQDAATALVLSAVNEHPIRLNSALTADLVASYPLVNRTTEAYIKPNCLLFTSNTRFAAGSNSLISIFDVTRPGQEPVLSVKTGPKNRNNSATNLATSMRGIVSALAHDPQYNVLAAGTFTRHVGLYDAAGSGDCVGVLSVEDTQADNSIGGQGVTQLLWSPCGRYLYIVERRSNGVMMYDIRKTGQLLGWLTGRNSYTNQRLHVDLVAKSSDGEHEVWAGGTDGAVRVWDNPQLSDAAITPSHRFPVHQDAVSCATVHRSGTVVATASGQRHFSIDNDESQNESTQALQKEFAVKIWSLRQPGIQQNAA